MTIRSLLRWRAGLLAFALTAGSAAQAQVSPPVSAPVYRHAGQTNPAIGVFCLDLSGAYTGCGGASPSTPGFVTSAPITRTTLRCTLPAYATGGNAVCTNEAGAQTTTACAANTACLIAAARDTRRTAEFFNRTPASTIEIGYAASLAPGQGKPIDGPQNGSGAGGSVSESAPPHKGPYYAATATAGALLVIVQDAP